MTEPELKSANFLPRETLGLSEPQYCGLVKTLALLESGELDHWNPELGFSHFDMAVWQKPATHNCGSVCCLGGTASMLMGRHNIYGPGSWLCTNRPELFRVFYPNGEFFSRRHPGWHGTTKEAAMVLRHYLETGNGNWDLPYRK